METLQALVYRRAPLRYLAGRAAARWRPRHFWGALAPLRLERVARPCPDGWLRLKVRLCGICGSDLRLLRGAESFLLEPYASFPAVLGHECVAEVEAAPAGSAWRPGARVAVEPLLPCAARGLPPCRFCAAGAEQLCECFTQGALAPGLLGGYHREVGGGFAEALAAHPRQLYAVPEGVTDEVAVLTDSLASALQPALDHFPADNEVVVVYGAGILGQHLVRVLRAHGCRARIVVAARHAFQQRLALAGGADVALCRPSRRALGEAVGARFLPTTLGGGNLEGGATRVFDCVGSTRSVQESLLLLRGRGRLVLVGTAARLGPLDASSLWFRELTIVGSNCYGLTTWRDGTRRTYQRALDLLAGGYPAAGLLTHVYALADYRRAFQAALDKPRFASVKVALDPRARTGEPA